MIPSKHPKCYHPAQSLDTEAFRYQDHLNTDIRQRFARARDDLQRPQFKLVGQSAKPAEKPEPKQAQSR